MTPRAVTDPLVDGDVAAAVAALRGRVDALSARVRRLEEEAGITDEEEHIQL